jgi:hypothetical protein
MWLSGRILSCSPGDSLRFLTYPGYINLVGTEASAGFVNTGWLENLSRSDNDEYVIDSFIKNLRLSPGEQLSILPDNHITLWGVDDMEIYQKQRQLWLKVMPLIKYLRHASRNSNSTPEDAFLSAPEELQQLYHTYEEFDRLDKMRAEILINNLLKKLDEHDRFYNLNCAALICCGHLPEYMGEYLNKINVSHVIIRPASNEADEFEKYEELFVSDIAFTRSKPGLSSKKIRRMPFTGLLINILSLWNKIKK